MLIQKEATLKHLYMLKVKVCIVHYKIKISSVIKFSNLEKYNSFTYRSYAIRAKKILGQVSRTRFLMGFKNPALFFEHRSARTIKLARVKVI